MNKKIHLDMVGLDGNAFFLLGAFRRQAKKENWSGEEIRAVTDEMTSGDYDHLLAVMDSHCVAEEGE